MKSTSGFFTCLVITSILIIGTVVFTLLPATMPVASAETITFGVGVYWDKGCTNLVSWIDWGTVEPGEKVDKMVYVRNEENYTATLFLATKNWDPVNASDYISLGWNYSGESIRPNEVLQINLTLSITPNIKGITNYSFEINITTASGGSTHLALTIPGMGTPCSNVTVYTLLTDSADNPVPNQQVHFHVSGYPLSGIIFPTSAYTNADGVAYATLTLPSTPSTLVLDAVYYGSDLYYASSQLKTIAVLPIYQTTITAEASPVNIAPGDTSTITFRLKDEHGNPLANQPVSFKTTAGTLSSAEGVTDGNGQASVVLTAPRSTGQVVVFASFAGLITTDTAYQPSEGGVGVSLGGTMISTMLKLTTSPSLASPGKTITLYATLSDSSGAPLEGKTVYFVTNGLATPRLQSSLTNPEGVATAKVTMPNSSAIDVLNCYFAGDSFYLAGEQLKVVASPPIFQGVMTATVSQGNIAVGGSSTITFALRDESGGPLSGQLLTFLTTAGNLSAESGTTDSDGVVTVKLTMTESDIAVVSASFGGLLSTFVCQPSMVRIGIASHIIS